ncbi:hypothetical protein ACJJV6_07310 [Arthrobacter nitrophenolicus]|jgi:hypothetical protein|uniref:Uncharacterized protein n=2 Tax=Arthrobacter nitrophenolicus TaxID=683150 RepID=A0ACC6TF77_9MICC|nr:hypothetical protein [Arthrobacter nitrophenolicus]ELT44391.1 hypothetical protein G205_12245 [Arthrobacter nitrophenolicus]
MGNDPGGSIWGVTAQRSAEVQQLAARLILCEARAEEVLAGFREIQMQEWQSPAGQAYRNTVSLQAAAMRRVLDSLHEAASSVTSHARAVLASECNYGGPS